MPELIAQGLRPEHRWRRALIAGQTHVLGRHAGAWSVPWDEHVSGRHVELTWSRGRLQVAKLPSARNPIFFLGQAQDACSIRAGEHFVLGSTTFSLVDEPLTIMAAVPPMTELTFTVQQLREVAFRDAARRIEVLSRIPEIIPGEISDEELSVRLVEFLLAGVPRAAWGAVVSLPAAAEEGGIQILQWDQRLDARTQLTFSESLIRQAMSAGESVAHVWSQATSALARENEPLPGWAFCTPVRSSASRGWYLYVAGRDNSASTAPRDAADLQDDVKFTELLADAAGRILELRRLERRQAVLSQFLSPRVLEQLADEDPEAVMAPRECHVSVLFCDLRGFSRVSEQAAQDLLGLLQRVSQALGVMTRRILEHGGVIGDFHGDAAMGFWGWPLEQPDQIEQVCRAALAISADFAAAAGRDGHPLADFRIGIGVASGPAVAGRIGTSDQVKITVFGPVVNLAARLQELTKHLRAPILIDDATAQRVRQQVATRTARLRRVARIRPRGLEAAVEVSQLLPPAARTELLADEHIAAYEQALDALLAGDWERAFTLLHRVPAEDRVKDFLTVWIAQHHRTPPANWDGIIDLSRSGG